jgi:hypothetical protein
MCSTPVTVDSGRMLATILIAICHLLYNTTIYIYIYIYIYIFERVQMIKDTFGCLII